MRDGDALVVDGACVVTVKRTLRGGRLSVSIEAERCVRITPRRSDEVVDCSRAPGPAGAFGVMPVEAVK